MSPDTLFSPVPYVIHRYHIFSDTKWDVRLQDCTITGRSKCQDVLLRYFDLGDTCCGLLLFMANKGGSIEMIQMDPIPTFFLMLCIQYRDKIIALLIYHTETKHLRCWYMMYGVLPNQCKLSNRPQFNLSYVYLQGVFTVPPNFEYQNENELQGTRAPFQEIFNVKQLVK